VHIRMQLVGGLQVQLVFFDATMATGSIAPPPGLSLDQYPFEHLNEPSPPLSLEDGSADECYNGDGAGSVLSDSVYGDSECDGASEEEQEAGEEENTKRRDQSQASPRHSDTNETHPEQSSLVQAVHHEHVAASDSTRVTDLSRPGSYQLAFYADKYNLAEGVGNIGWGYCNMGELEVQTEKTRVLEQIMKRHPGTILAFGEAGPATEALFRKEGVPGLTLEQLREQSYEAHHHLKRPSFQYLTIRGNERSSLMIAVRRSLAKLFTCHLWQKLVDGQYLRKSTSRPMQAYTRLMVCEITLKENAGNVGKTQVIMNVQLHHKTANHYFGKEKLDEHFENMASLIREHNVTVLMGDFSTALTLVVPTLRTFGIEIDLGAWFPWKESMDGAPMMDSTGIFFVNMPGKHELEKGLSCIHDRDESGFLCKESFACQSARDDELWNRIPKNAGPGQPLEAYLPKTDGCGAKGTKVQRGPQVVADLKMMLFNMLTPSCASEAAVEELHDCIVGKQQVLHTREKRLRFRSWPLHQPCDQKGSHYPLWVTTINRSRRSPEAVQWRHQKMRRSWQPKEATHPRMVYPTSTWNRSKGWGWPDSGTSQWKSNDSATDWQSKTEPTSDHALRNSRHGSGQSKEEDKGLTNTCASTDEARCTKHHEGAFATIFEGQVKVEQVASLDSEKTFSHGEGAGNGTKLKLNISSCVPPPFDPDCDYVTDVNWVPCGFGWYIRMTTKRWNNGWSRTVCDWVDDDDNIVNMLNDDGWGSSLNTGVYV
jgi:hypothetical protein